ncbi:hypothetical protein ZHAS_00005177 [Anopheles sinensis]|uniref:Uncharacterized protein n=1 Tax=Anopheles sinensis TaxID=74873 RepID=A0A084VIR7_ANOSI|nr:hypothetical protein ZHAS_00005177 [Anopheles sinensis]
MVVVALSFNSVTFKSPGKDNYFKRSTSTVRTETSEPEPPSDRSGSLSLTLKRYHFEGAPKVHQSP